MGEVALTTITAYLFTICFYDLCSFCYLCFDLCKLSGFDHIAFDHPGSAAAEDLVADLIILSAALEDIGTMYVQCDRNAERDIEDGVGARTAYGRVSSLAAVSEDLYF